MTDLFEEMENIDEEWGSNPCAFPMCYNAFEGIIEAFETLDARHGLALNSPEYENLYSKIKEIKQKLISWRENEKTNIGITAS